MVLVGPSGCGKSTTLRMIAGLEEVTSGIIDVGGVVINSLSPKDRDIAMVFQNYALYPHMTVFGNLAFGLKLRKTEKSEIERRVSDAAKILGLESLLQRRPKELSGGQRQRVAVGRAIVRNPKVFLFDEPLSNLDAKMRVSMRSEISKLHQRLQATMIYVTHDQVEAMTMGDRICVMSEGEIMQVDEPMNLYNEPANLFVAGFIGSPPMNLLKGEIAMAEGELRFQEIKAERVGFEIKISDCFMDKLEGQNRRKVVLGIRAEDLTIVESTEGEDTAEERFSARTELSEPMGAETLVYLDTGLNRVVVKEGNVGKRPNNTDVTVTFEPEKARFFDSLSGAAI